MAVKIMNGKAKQLSQGLISIIYGVPGGGKTFACRTLPDNKYDNNGKMIRQTVVLDFDKGTEPLLGKDITIISIPFPKIGKEIAEFKKIIEAIETGGAYQGIRFDNVKHLIIDNISELLRFFQDGFTKFNKRTTTTLGEYNVSSQRIMEYVRRLRDLKDKGIWTTLIAHEDIIKTVDENGIELSKLCPKVGLTKIKEIMGLVDIVGRVEYDYSKDKKNNVQSRLIRIAEDPKIHAKMRVTGFLERYGETVEQDLNKLYTNIYKLKQERM